MNNFELNFLYNLKLIFNTKIIKQKKLGVKIIYE